MKKILFFLTVIGLSLTSCSTDEQPTGNSSTEKTIDVALNVVSETPVTTTPTSKNVQRGSSIPASVAAIKVTTTKGGVTKTYEDFNIVDNDPSADSNFILNDVPTGVNTFNAVTTTNATKYLVLAPDGSTAENKLIDLKKHAPYVLYTGLKENYNVLGTGVNQVAIPMTTQFGRLLTIFQLENDATFKANYKATVSAKIYSKGNNGNGNGNYTEVGSQNGAPVENSNIVYFEWSNEYALADNKVIYTIVITPKNNNNNKSYTYTIEQVIKASTSISCIYTVTKDNAPSPYISENQLTFQFQKWIEENCPDYPNCK